MSADWYVCNRHLERDFGVVIFSTLSESMIITLLVYELYFQAVRIALLLLGTA